MKRKKQTFLSKENYVILLTSIYLGLTERFSYNKDCVYDKTGVHTCLPTDYFKYLGDRLVDFVMPDKNFKVHSETVLNDLICKKSGQNVSFWKSDKIYNDDVFPIVAVEENNYLNVNTYPMYIFFVDFCVILEKEVLQCYEWKKIFWDYMLFFFRQEGKIKRKEKKAIKKLHEDIYKIEKDLTLKEILKRISDILRTESYNKNFSKQSKEYFIFLDYMRRIINWYMTQNDEQILGEFVGLLLEKN